MLVGPLVSAHVPVVGIVPLGVALEAPSWPHREAGLVTALAAPMSAARTGRVDGVRAVAALEIRRRLRPAAGSSCC